MPVCACRVLHDQEKNETESCYNPKFNLIAKYHWICIEILVEKLRRLQQVTSDSYSQNLTDGEF